MKNTFAFLLGGLSLTILAGSVPASALTFSEPLSGVYAQYSANHECRSQLGQGWRLPEAAELQAAIELGQVPGLAPTYPGAQPGSGAVRYLWSATPWTAAGPKWWGKLYRLEDRTWVREADEYCYTVVCVRD